MAPKSPKKTGRQSGASTLVAQGFRHHQAGRLAQAEQLYRQAIARDPNQADAHHFMGILANQAGKTDIAVHLIQKAVSLNPNLTAAHFNLGVALEKINQPDAAAASYTRAVSLDNTHGDALLHLGRLEINRGQWENAARCFERLSTLSPGNIEARFYLGVALENLNRDDAAVSAYEATLALKPDLFEALNNLANIFNRNGAFDRAIPLYRNALAARPEDPEAMNNLAVALGETGSTEEALTWLEKAVALRPDYAQAYNSRGNIHERNGNLEAAIGNYEKAVAVAPDFAQAHYNLGLALEQTGRLADSVTCLRRTLALEPGHAEAHRHLANAVHHERYDETVRAMEDLYRLDGIPAKTRIHLGFGLAKAFSDLNDARTSFDYLARANQTMRGLLDYDLAEDKALFNRVKTAFTRQAPDTGMTAGCSDETPVFIVGMPRSGTTLVEQILASHPQIHGAGELDNLSRIARGFLQQKSPRADDSQLPGRELAQAGQAYIGQLREHSASARRITDKMPHNFLFIGLIHQILPKARIIHCTRDPMATCYSIYKTLFQPWNSHRYAYDLSELGQYYRLYAGLMAHWHHTLPGIIHDIRYEDLVTAQEKETRKLLDICGMAWDARCLSFHKSDRPVATTSSRQVRSPLYRDALAFWKHFDTQLAPLKNVLLQKTEP